MAALCVGDGDDDDVLCILVPSRKDSYFLHSFPFLLYVTFERSDSSTIKVRFVLKASVHLQRLFWNSSLLMFYSKGPFAVCLLDE